MIRLVPLVFAAVLVAAPASAQLGGLAKGLSVAKKANDAIVTEAEKQAIGAGVSENIRTKFGVVQDARVHRYVTLVGALLALKSQKPDYTWRFIVLDTDAVNAFAAPGGSIHITKGALALMSSEAERAGVLGHELVHVIEDHTVKAITKGGLISAGTEATGKGGLVTSALVDKVTDVALQGFGRGEELESDHDGAALANKAGYQPDGLLRFLQKLRDRNRNATDKRGLFASHPQMQERLDKLTSQIGKERLAAAVTLEPRYRQFVSYTPVAQTSVASVAAGSAGLAGGSAPAKKDSAASKTADAKNDDAPKKRGFGLGGLAKNLGGGEKKSGQTVASGGARGVDPEVDAKGGPNPGVVAVNVTPGEIETFRKDGKLA